MLRKDPPDAHLADAVTGAPDPLKATGDRARRFDHHHEVDRAHVDAELEGAGRHDGANAPRLEVLFDLSALLVGDAAVMAEDEGHRLAFGVGQVVEALGEALAETSTVDEDDRRPVRADELHQLGVDHRPHAPLLGVWRALLFRRRGHRTARRHAVVRCCARVFGLGRRPGHVLHRDDDLEVEVRLRARVDDRHRAIAAEEARHFLHGSRGSREADALRLVVGELRHPLEGEGEVRAAFGRCEGVHLVDDDVLDRAQRPSRLTAQDQVERLGRGHEDLARVLRLTAPVARAGVAGAHVDLRRSVAHTETRRRLSDADERCAEVPFDVVDEGLEGRDVEDADAGIGVVGQPPQSVEGEEEGGEGLAAPRGRREKGVGPGGDRLEALGLNRRGRFEALLEPEPGRRAESLHRRSLGRMFRGVKGPS